MDDFYTAKELRQLLRNHDDKADYEVVVEDCVGFTSSEGSFKEWVADLPEGAGDVVVNFGDASGLIYCMEFSDRMKQVYIMVDTCIELDIAVDE